MNESSAGPPTLWIVIAGVCALAAIGLGIWAFSTKSDLDDAEETIERQQQQLASQKQAASGAEARLVAFGRRQRADYRAVRRHLIGERAAAANLQKKIRTEAGELDQARTEVSDAQGQDQKEAAQLKQEQARARLGIACSASAVDALNRFVEAASARVGASKAVRQLEATQKECASAAEE
jgi:hypothetical protein